MTCSYQFHGCDILKTCQGNILVGYGSGDMGVLIPKKRKINSIYIAKKCIFLLGYFFSFFFEIFLNFAVEIRCRKVFRIVKIEIQGSSVPDLQSESRTTGKIKSKFFQKGKRRKSFYLFLI